MNHALTNTESVPTSEAIFSQAADRATGPNGTPVQVLRDWEWIMQQEAAGAFERYRGQHIAVHDKKVLASHADPRELDGLHLQLGIPAVMVIIKYLDG